MGLERSIVQFILNKVQFKPFNRTAIYNVLIHDLFNIRYLNTSVKNTIGIHHHGWPQFTDIKATGFLRPNRVVKFPVEDSLFEGGYKSKAVVISTTGPAAFGALIVTNKNVFLIF